MTPSDPPSPAERLQAVQRRIEAACRACGRDPSGVSLLAVGKTFPAEVLRALHAAGQRRFGENYVQEALAKMDALADLAGPHTTPEWHLIGPLQSNKTRPVAERFDWVHSVDRLKLAERLAAQRPAWMAPLQVCLQVDVDDEPTKSGATVAELPALAHAVAALPPERLRLRGLMAIPRPAAAGGDPAAAFAKVKALLDDLRAQGLALDTLSMGMSADLEAAIAAGSTIVRVGTALFGSR